MVQTNMLKYLPNFFDIRIEGNFAKLSESPYTKIISDGVLKLQEDGILTQLRNKWWNQKYVPEEPCVSINFQGISMLEISYLYKIITSSIGKTKLTFDHFLFREVKKETVLN